MRTIGVDAHVLTGKHQGSRVWLEGVLAKVGTIDRQNRWILYSGDSEVTKAAFPFPNFVHRSMPCKRAMPRLLLGWPAARKRDRLDVLITQYIAPPFFGGKQCVVVHDILFESHPQLFPFSVRWRNRLLVRLSARRADVILAPSQFTRSELLKIYRLEPGRVVLAPNAAPSPSPRDPAVERASMVRMLGEDWDRPFILSVGRIEPRKNVDLLLAAWRAVGRPDVMLVVVGSADFGAERTVRALREDPNVRHLMDVTGDELLALYRRALVFVFPSAAEGFGIPILEALSVGTRVIHSNTTAMPEVGGPYTRTFDPFAPDSEKVLAKLIDEEIQQQGADPVSWMNNLGPHLGQFTWERSARALVDVVNAIGKA
jgi:glycosyltransferase involved in cell wall biosynthesis